MAGLRRSLHFVPGANARMLEKSLALPADALVLDLEDAVTPDRKDDARRGSQLARIADFGRQEAVVRANPLDTPGPLIWKRCSTAGRRTLVPKARGPEDLRVLHELLQLERMGQHEEG